MLGARHATRVGLYCPDPNSGLGLLAPCTLHLAPCTLHRGCVSVTVVSSPERSGGGRGSWGVQEFFAAKLDKKEELVKVSCSCRRSLEL